MSDGVDMSVALARIEVEYGVPATVAGARMWARISSAERRPIRTAGAYVALCRRLDPTLARGGVAGVDGRLVAVGFRHVPPREWVLGDRRDGREPRSLADFVAWWQATQPRPGVVGSAHNAEPELAFQLWSAGPAVRRALRGVAVEAWSHFANHGRIHPRNLHRARDIGRAAARASARECSVTVSARALAALGRCCPEMQRAALEGSAERAIARTPGHGWQAVVRVRDLDWAAAAAVQAEIQRGGERARLRIAYRLRGDGRISRRFDHLRDGRGTDFLSPAYPAVTFEIAVRLFLGESPVQISGGHLTRREAHEWLMEGERLDGMRTPAEWLVRNLDIGGARLRSVSVARWLLDVHRRGGWGGLTRERTVHGPAGATAVIRYLDRIDEIMDEDLIRGARTSVEDAFRHAAERAGAAWAEKQREDHRVLAGAPRWRLYPCMRPLLTPAQLIAEGREMGHCVGTYVPAVERGESHIVALRVRGHRSTVELAPDGRVRQHKGPGDGQPHTLCQRALALWCRRRGGNVEPTYKGGYR